MKIIKGMIGKSIIIGLTYLNSDDEVDHVTQMHGEIMEITKEKVLVRISEKDELFSLPPDLTAIKTAPPGEYRFKSTGEVIVNPDFMTSWTIHMN